MISILMHGHHAGLLFTYGITYADRVEDIEVRKPAKERELRLALMKDVTSLVPHNAELTALDQAYAALDQADAAWEKAYTAWARAMAYAARKKADAARKKADAAVEKADAAREKARATYEASFDVVAFHTEHCHPNCRYFEGNTIFASGDVSMAVLQRVPA